MNTVLKKTNAFTIVELIVVITVIAILTGGAALSITSNARNARDTRRRTDIQQIKSSLEFYRSAQPNGFYPVALPTLVPSFMEAVPTDPSSTTTTVINYTYTPAPSGCNNTTTLCTTYSLSTSLETGTTYQVTPLSIQ